MLDLIPHAFARVISFQTNCPSATTGTGTGTYFSALCPITNQNITLADLVDTAITYILYIAGALAVIYLLYAGILYITAGGDEAKATKARTGIVNAVIGVIIIILAFVIEKAAANLFV